MTVVDIFEQELGQEIGPDLIADIHAIPSHRITAAADRYAAWAEEGTDVIGPRRPGELRPLITSQAMYVSSLKYGFPFERGFDGWAADAAPAPLEDALKRLLLFCHRLVVDDPIVYVTDWLRRGEVVDSLRRAELRDKLAAMLTFLSYLRPLLAEEIITFIPPTRVNSALLDWRKDAFTRSRALADAGEFGSLEAAMGSLPRDVRIHLADTAFESVRVTVALGQQFPDRLDLFLPDPIFTEAASARLTGGRPRVGTAERHAETLHHLMNLKVPRLEDLTVQDVVAIRQHEDAFVLWRDDLRNALAAAAAVDVRLAPEGEQADAVREVMVAAGARLRHSVEGSPVLNHASRGAFRLAIGGLVDLILKPKEVLAERTKQAADLVAEAIADHPHRPTAVLRHYTLFEPFAGH